MTKLLTAKRRLEAVALAKALESEDMRPDNRLDLSRELNTPIFDLRAMSNLIKEIASVATVDRELYARWHEKSALESATMIRELLSENEALRAEIRRLKSSATADKKRKKQ